MIVNPQVFNYKIVIGTLAVAFTSLAIYSYTNYSALQSKEAFFTQEKKLLEHQISQVISSYDNLKTLNNDLELKLSSLNELVKKTHDSLEFLQKKSHQPHTYNSQIKALKQEVTTLKNKERSYIDAQQSLLKQKESISNKLDIQKQMIANLNTNNEILNTNIKNAALLSANSFEASAYLKKTNGDIITIKKANRTKNIRVAFVLAENILTEKGEKELYIQIIGPDKNVIADKGVVRFDESSLIYSSKINVNYNNKALEVCTDVETSDPLTNGKYYVSVFEKGRRLGSTQIVLH